MGQNSVEYRLLLNDKQFMRELSRATQKTQQLKKNVSGVGGGFSKIGGMLAGAGIGIAIASIGKKVFDLGKNMEQTRISFATFTGSAEKGNQVLKELN